MNESPVNSGKSEVSDAVVKGFRIAGEQQSAVDRYSDFLSDWFSPILVKETRQALKSRQFFWTFFLLLTAVAVWTLIGLTINDTSVEYGNAGPSLLTGYWVILGFPLSIVIPFGAYRSLAREYEDGTIQLISVTTMKAWQIVAGKLGSSLLQTLIYLAVLAPCIAFTYLLRGLSIPQISLGMTFCISGCFALSCIALFFAGATRSRVYSVGVSILLIAIQVFVYWLWIMGASGLAFGELDFLTRSEGLFISFGIVAAVVSTGLLMFAAATAMISFRADNRSTIVRVMMLVQQTLFIGWTLSMMCYVIQPEMAAVMTFVTAHYWLLMGFLMVGEDMILSQRVRRSIPETTATRSLFSLFLPGSGRGLIFAVTNLWFCAAVFLLAVILGPQWLPEGSAEGQPMFGNQRSAFGSSDWSQIPAGLISICLYASFFLSVIYFVCSWLRRRGRIKVNPVISFALGVVMVVAMTGFSLLFHFNFFSRDDARYYSPDQIFNWYWTSIELVDSGFDVIHMELAFAFVVMSSLSVVALVYASRELLQTRLSTPARVQQEIEETRQGEQLPPGETIDEIFAADRVEVD